MLNRLFRLWRGVVLLAASALLTPSAALAWGDEGHQIVALIAEHHLQPAVRIKLFTLLTQDADPLTAHDIASESVWADRYRETHREETQQWHYVDIELHWPDLPAACFGHPALPAGTQASAGPAQACVVDKIDQFAAELGSPSTPPAERLLALKFLLHFVGDLHQPLHASDDGDSGGNGKRVKASNGKFTKLHAYWDTFLVEKLGSDANAVADKLIARISAGDRQRWAASSSAGWAMESFGIARDTVYGKLPAPVKGVYTLGRRYETECVTQVSLQLQRGGVRLAELLNRALAE